MDYLLAIATHHYPLIRTKKNSQTITKKRTSKKTSQRTSAVGHIRLTSPDERMK